MTSASGPYRFVRHPIYSGLLIMFVGTALEAGGLHCWLALPLVVVGFWIKLRQEEALLLRHFPFNRKDKLFGHVFNGP